MRAERLLVAALCAVGSALPARAVDALAPGAPPADPVAGFGRELERLLDHYRVPGAAAAIVVGGELRWEGAAGLAAVDGAAADTVFQVASLSKPVAALGVLLLAEDGRVELDRPVWDYLDGFRLQPSSWDASGVTIRRLLCHRGGLSVHGYPGYLPGSPLPTLLESLRGRSGGAGPVALVAEPGAGVLYSSGGYSLLQLLVESVTGETFAGYMERRVLRPLVMTRSSFEPRPDLALAAGHGWWGGRLPAYRFTEQAASGLLATAGDLGRFLTVLSSPEAQRRVGVSAATVQSMLEAPRGGFGLGFEVEPEALQSSGGAVVRGTHVVSHNGANRGFRAVMAAAPARGDGLVVLTDSDRGMAMTTDLLCRWGRGVSPVELASCWAERKRRGTLLAVAGLIGLGLALDVAALLRRRRELRPGARPSWAPRERHGWTGWIRLGASLTLLAGWWAFWYTDLVARSREGISHFVPASSLPPTFSWLTAVLSAWCLLGVLRFWASARGARGPLPDALAPRSEGAR